MHKTMGEYGALKKKKENMWQNVIAVSGDVLWSN